MYYDRGELFSYFSPGYAIGTVTGGPFGVNQQLPFVNASSCPVASQYFYEGYIPTCGGSDAEGNLENPYGTSLLAPPNNPKASDLNNYLPNANAIVNDFGQPISLGVYDRTTSCPTPSTTRSMSSGSRATTSPSKSAMSATSDVTRSFRFRSTSPHRLSDQPHAGGRSVPAELQLRLQRRRRDCSTMARPISPTTRAATSTCAFPTSAMRLNPSPTTPPASTPTTRSRCTSTSA